MKLLRFWKRFLGLFFKYQSEGKHIHEILNYSTSTGGAMACRFLQAKWFDLQKRFGRGSMNFAKIITAITKYGANKFDYDEVSILF